MINQEQLGGKWDQLKGKIKQQWGQLTDDEVALYNGSQDQFFGRLKEKYGIEKEEAEKRMRDLAGMGGGDALEGDVSDTTGDQDRV
jgi:uncharacterized protein YjbJ (UPF0337 family)